MIDSLKANVWTSLNPFLGMTLCLFFSLKVLVVFLSLVHNYYNIFIGLHFSNTMCFLTKTLPFYNFLTTKQRSKFCAHQYISSFSQGLHQLSDKTAQESYDPP